MKTCFYILTTWIIKILKIWKKNTWKYYHFTHVHHKWESYDILFLRHRAQQKFLSFWVIFCPFNPLTTQKIKIPKKMTKTPGDIVFHKCTINDNHMMYFSWDTECNREFFIILGHILPFILPLTRKIKILKKWKNQLHISLYTCVTLMTIIQSYDVWVLGM